MKFRKLYIFCAVFLMSNFLISCGKKKTKKQDQGALPPIESGSLGPNKSICDGYDKSTVDIEFNSSNVSFLGTRMLLYPNYRSASSEKKSLCEFIKSSGRSVIILQHASVVCESCKKDAKIISDYLNNSSKKQSIKHYIVFNDQTKNNWDNDFPAFMKQHTPAGDSSYIFDHESVFYRFNLTKSDDGQSEGVLGAVLILNPYGDIYHLAPTEDHSKLPNALKLAEAMVATEKE